MQQSLLRGGALPARNRHSTPDQANDPLYLSQTTARPQACNRPTAQNQVVTDDEGDPLPDSAVRAAVQHAIRDGLLAAEFPACEKGGTAITYPFVFE
jgi:hypothetical protein